MRRRVLLLVVAAGGLLSSCTAPVTGRLELCEYIRQAVREGLMPLDLARAQYPECKVTESPQ